MNPSDVTMFVKQLVLSSEGAKMVPLEARMEYCQKVIRFSSEQEGKEQVSADELSLLLMVSCWKCWCQGCLLLRHLFCYLI